MALLDSLKIGAKTDDEFEEEIGQQFAQDPEPGQASGRGRKAPAARRVPAAPSKAATTKLAKDLAEDLAGLIELGAITWGMSDDCCAPVLESSAEPIANAITACLAKKPRLLAAFAQADLVSWTLLLSTLYKALQPVGKAIYRNHISKAVDEDVQGVSHDPGAIRLNEFPAFSGIPRS